ncbi:DUF4395 domain-containing protein [Phytoactinopolyspora alkaliphila]|uniref:DUF4395 domain-containing protein n=1 Tax=Phytoactinopolyspora alkaliphila TaxID=1783498 RepID=A0A6N9YJ92_9ACTN|nr:DUF4395 domain-containing protein [Phytoactinopolyspora alkaliphila]NED94968.1 DUF4395 domain-containing protein [Phytoactinopolyspora alkaliphila]
MIDPRGPRFAATITTVVLAVVLVTGSPWLLAVQGVVFGLAVIFGVAASPYGLLFRRLVRPRIGPPGELESPEPPRFAQAVGLVFTVAGLVGYLSDVTLIAYIAVGAALAAAFLNAAFGYCLGCEIYLLYRRFFPARTTNTPEVSP